MSSSLAVKPQYETPPPTKQRTTRQVSTLPLVAPSVVVLLLWMIRQNCGVAGRHHRTNGFSPGTVPSSPQSIRRRIY
ncbi:MAG: hypothetical protein V7L14_28575 [Nostoc sp.]|uniref:hypothetical protein n=1 Tax=Nostoc sp. TaxID=1180 RepID=UPI002FFCFC68